MKEMSNNYWDRDDDHQFRNQNRWTYRVPGISTEWNRMKKAGKSIRSTQNTFQLCLENGREKEFCGRQLLGQASSNEQ